MQLDALALYNADGDIRTIQFHAGKLNIITGESGTGKTSLIGIIRFLLCDETPHVPRGPIQDAVTWYGLLAHVGDTHFFVGRPAPEAGMTTNQVMLSIGQTEVPEYAALAAQTNTADLVQYLGGLVGISDNRFVPPVGQTRPPLAANLRHSLYYCFQGQGEIANRSILFHHQDHDFQKQAIRDTMPYFLGAQDMEAVRKREELTRLRRSIRMKTGLLNEALDTRANGDERAWGLVVQARSRGMLPRQTADAGEPFAILAQVLLAAPDPRPAELDADSLGETLVEQRNRLRDGLRNLGDRLKALNEFARVEEDYASELDEHRARLASLGLVPADADPATLCPVCERPLEDHGEVEDVRRALERVSEKLELAERDRPRVEAARGELLGQQDELRLELARVDAELESVVRDDDLRRAAETEWEQDSFLRGRISQFLDTSNAGADTDLDRLKSELDDLRVRASRLQDELDPEALREQINSLLAVVGRRMTDLAKSVPLEHSDHGVRIDPYRLTVVADTLKGPAYMDAGEIGSGMSWVGYHLTAYLALQEFFIEAQRPVPSFIVLDQLSQAFFPSDRQTGGDLSEMADADRENTRKLYKLLYDQVEAQNGLLQIIALDHADFSEPWFQDSVIETWRGGRALIPPEWLGDAE